MGKLKIKDKKFDRKVEISAPILDPEIVRAIHSQPGTHGEGKIDLRHGGFKVLLSGGSGGDEDDNTNNTTGSQWADDQSRPLTPTYEVNHLPSYIGISCAVSGYSNYSPFSPGSRCPPLDDSTNTTRSESNISKVSTSRLGSTPTPNHQQLTSRTSSPLRGPLISHFKLDKSKFGSIDQERRELVGLMTASISQKNLNSPLPGSPISPTESDRHHGAYVGARYSPMPDPNEEVPRHIPLLGIDDELDPSEAEAENQKVVRRVASLYGEDFAEGWKEDMIHKVSGQQPNEQQSESVRL